VRKDRVISVLYHRVVPDDVWNSFVERERIFSVSESRFRGQLEWLRDQGYTFLSMNQLVGHLKGDEAIPPKAAFVSFDDGCESVYSRALPILKELEIPSTVFVTTDPETWIFHSGEYHERRMTEDEIRACEEGGISVESHSVSHRGLNEMSDEEALAEMTESKEAITAWIGRPVQYFSIPLNFYNKRTLELCKEAGYSAVCVCDGATTNASSSPFRIRRFIVEGTWDMKQFPRFIAPRNIGQRRIIASIKRLPPKLLGEKRWMPLRARIFRSAIGKKLNFATLKKMLVLGSASGLAGLVFLTMYAFGS
jgi:peptidoglycan/xylan/chitin deacetylase (PgdA/CDA1 family)